MNTYISKIWVPSEQEIAAESAWIDAQLDELGKLRTKKGELALNALCLAAQKARENAYTPYSHYNVGAAILARSATGDWEIFAGQNNENVNYTNTGHAESNAVRAVIGAGFAKSKREFIKALVVCHAGDSGPCGACRQDLGEHAIDGNALIIVIDLKGTPVKVTSLNMLLPQAFGPRHLGIE